MASLADHEKANGVRLSQLLIDKGTEAMRNVFDSFHPPANLTVTLNSNRCFLQRLPFINRSQMHILFPPSGVASQSKDFDITLLFILLRNICGLHPPASTGLWDANPPATDTTREANLARIKYYRNKVYGHITTTGVNDTDFQSYWNDISTAVVGLGVSKGDVKFLKFAPLDENIYIQQLIEWKKGEDKVDVMLKEIERNQTEISHSLETIQENQKVVLENQKEASNALKTTFVGQEAVLKNQQAVLEDQTRTCRQLQEINAELNTSSKELKEAVQELKSMPRNTDTENLCSQMKEWNEKEDRLEIMMKQHQNEPSTRLESLLQNHRRTLRNQEVILDENRRKIEDENSSDFQQQPSVLQHLAKIEFKSNIESLNKSFHSNTRKWLLKKLDRWFRSKNSDSQVMILTAGPGIGKSVFAAKVCKIYEEKERFAACHFCKFNYSDYSNPHKMMQSLANHMCENVPGFREKLTEQLQRAHSKESITDAFRVLLKDPLNSLLREKPLLLVIDGLDESEKDGKSELLDLIAKEFPLLPKWLKIFITSRPELPVRKKLHHLNPIEILPDDKNNKTDLRCYLQACLTYRYKLDERNLNKLVKKCEGSFLYAYHCQLELNRLPINTDVVAFGPKGISSVYEDYFTRLEEELKTLSPNIQFDRILEVLVAMKGPLPLSFMAEILELSADTRSMRKVIQKVNESLSALLLVYDDCLTVFHKSVVDWIMCKGYEQHSFSIQEAECISGHKYLWRACQKRLVGSKLEKPNSYHYASEHGAIHLREITMQPPRETFAMFDESDEELSSNYEGIVRMYDDTLKPFGWGWLIAEDIKDIFLMTINTALCHLKNLWHCNSSNEGDGNIFLQPPSGELTVCYAVRTENDFPIISSDGESVLNYAVLRLRLLSEAHFCFPLGFLRISKRSPNPGDKLIVTGGKRYHFRAGVYKYPEDLLNWLKSGGNVKNPLVKCEPEINWNTADLRNILIPYGEPFGTTAPSLLMFDINSDESQEVIGMYTCTIKFNFDPGTFVSVAVRIETIIEDINEKQPDLARKLFPSYFKKGNV